MMRLRVGLHFVLGTHAATALETRECSDAHNSEVRCDDTVQSCSELCTSAETSRNNLR
jgi:hypothetical protein